MRKREGFFCEPSSRFKAALALAGMVAILSGCRNEVEPAAPASGETHPAPEATILLAPPLPQGAPLSEALSHPDPFERARRVAEILAASPPDRLPELTAAFEAAPLPWGDAEYALFASWWARFDPAAAMVYCYEDSMRMRNPRAMSEVIRMWAFKDPQAVIKSQWLNNITIDMAGLNPEMVHPFVVGWFESGQPGLDAWIQGIDATTKATAIGTYMRMRILRDGPRAALEWTKTAPYDPATQRLLLATGLNVVARLEPQLAVEWLGIAEKDGIDTRSFVARIGRGWAHKDPQAAMEWVTTQELEVLEAARSINDIAEMWLDRDPKSLENWMEERKDKAWVDSIRQQWIFHHVKQNRYDVDWVDMMDRAAKFVNDENRRKEYLWIFQRWNVADPEPAAAWLAKNEALLGDKLQYAHQLYIDEQKEIEEALAERDLDGKDARATSSEKAGGES